VAVHTTIFVVRYYDPYTRYKDLLDRVLRHRDAIISHLNWACIFLGFHSFNLYIHNDTMSALGTANILVHHIHAFTIHVTVLILLKGVLFSRSSHLIPDKANLGFNLPCDRPGRGVTCQVSAWDHVILGLF
ncbi:photosystem i p700 chlorophyll a apoprotein a1, partial [Phtheirospermum japonicum]